MLLILACLSLWGLRTGGVTNPPPSRPSLAINVAGPADWNTELPFVDLFHFTRDWISQQEGKGWGQGPALDADTHGWVRSLPPKVTAETFLTSYGDHYPAGDYVVLFDGDGDLAFSSVVVAKAQTKGRIVISVDPKRGPFSLEIQRTNPADPLRNIRVIMPGCEATYRTKPFNPSFLRRWKGVSAVRFMDWMNTNGTHIRTWADRPHLEDATWAGKGIPAEMLFDLANQLKADCWVCIPHLANDEFVHSFATMASSRLNPGLRIYLEYSNEVWNGQFEQSRYAGEQGLKERIGEKPWDAGWHWYARRSTQVFDIWSRVFPKERLVRVLASQAGNAYVADQILGFEGAAKHADALAIAPYIGFTPSNDSNPSAATIAKWNLTELFGYVRSHALADSIGFMRENKKIAAKYGLPLIAYEGGQHLVGVGGAENNESLTNLFITANRDPRMGLLYDDYLKAWKSEGGGLFSNFSSVGSWSKWGSWGLLEFSGDDPGKSAKMVAIKKWARALGQNFGGP